MLTLIALLILCVLLFGRSFVALCIVLGAAALGLFALFSVGALVALATAAAL